MQRIHHAHVPRAPGEPPRDVAALEARMARRLALTTPEAVIDLLRDAVGLIYGTEQAVEPGYERLEQALSDLTSMSVAEIRAWVGTPPWRQRTHSQRLLGVS